MDQFHDAHPVLLTHSSSPFRASPLCLSGPGLGWLMAKNCDGGFSESGRIHAWNRAHWANKQRTLWGGWGYAFFFYPIRLIGLKRTYVAVLCTLCVGFGRLSATLVTPASWDVPKDGSRSNFIVRFWKLILCNPACDFWRGWWRQ
jgi:hypothetical protein